MNNILSCVDSKARFTQTTYEVDQKVVIEVFIKSTCLNSLLFSYLSVTINTPNYSNEFAVSEGNPQEGGNSNPTLLFENNQVKRFLVEFVPDSTDIGQEIQVISVFLNVIHLNNTKFLDRINSTSFREQIRPLRSFKIHWNW